MQDDVEGGKGRDVKDDGQLEGFAFGERIINYIRWFLIVVFLLFNNLGFSEDRAFVLPINIVLLATVLLTAYVQIRLQRGHSFGWAVTLALSVIQDSLITAGVYLTGLYDSHIFIFYYPSLLGFSLAFSLRASAIYATVLGLVYTGLCWFLTPGLAGDPLAVKVLIERWLVLYIIAGVGGLLVRQERDRRVQAVARESRTTRENEQLYLRLNGQMGVWQQAGLEIEATAGQLTTLARDLAGLADGIGSGFEGVSSVVSSVMDRARDNVDQIAAIGQAAESYVAAAHDLAESAVSTGNASAQAQRAVDQATEAVEALGRRSQAIGGLAAAVRRVADQTNLLAFNASIEAIQAGQGGQRFAVVADEVRQVAERAIRLSREIDGLSYEVQQGTHQVLEAMAEIAQMVDQTVALVQITSGASRSQRTNASVMANSVEVMGSGARQTVDDIRTVSGTVQQQSVALQRIAVLSQELADSAGSLEALTRVLAG